MGQPSFFALLAQEQLALALDEGLDELAAALVPLTTSVIPALAWANGFLYAYVARTAARRGDAESALGSLARLVPWLERAPAWAVGFPIMACHAAETLWLLERLDHGPLVERCLRDKVVAPDFRSPMVDGRLALARVCALQGRHDEAQHWFTEARRVLTEQGARPLLAIADFDEAHMNARRTGHGDAERARPLLDTARRQFETIGMTGWFRRAEDATS